MSRRPPAPPPAAMQALLEVARSRIGGREPDRALLDADPAEVGRLAARHGLQGLLPELATADPAASDGSGMGLQAIAGNLERIRELHRVLKVLDAAGVPAIVLKGPALAVQAWGDVSLRSYGDVDLLVPPAAAEATVRALADAGYNDRWARFGRSPSPEQWYDWPFTAPDGRTLVEIHWSLVSPHRYPAVDTGEAWQPHGTRSVTVPGGEVPALAPELLLPYLAIHAMQHHWGWLEFPLTLAALIERSRGDLDWQETLGRARRWRVRRGTLVGLHLARLVAGSELSSWPPEVAAAMGRDPGSARLAAWYAHKLLHDADSDWHTGSPGLWLRALQLRDTQPERLRAAWQLLFEPTPAEWQDAAGDGVAAQPPDAGAWRRIARLWRRYRGNS